MSADQGANGSLPSTSSRKRYVYCLVPKCISSSKSTPEKRFFNVPQNGDIRNKWFEMCRREPGAPSTVFFCCEDHFDLERDVSNFVRHKLTGCPMRLKPGVLPSRFDCQLDRKDRAKSLGERSVVNKSINTDDILRPKSHCLDEDIDSSSSLIPHRAYEKVISKRNNIWSKEEDEQLNAVVQVYGKRRWKYIATFLPGRNSTQCYDRWRKILNPDLVKRPRTREVENNALKDNGNEDEDIEHLYPIQNMDILYDGESADEDSMQNPADLVETEMPDESQECEGVMVDADDDTGEIFNENCSSNQELQNEAYIEDFMFSNVDDSSNSNIEQAKEDGKAGTALGQFPTITKAVEAAEYEILQVLYQLLYQRSAWDTQEILSRRILKFSGFNFSQSSEEYFNREMMLQTQPKDVLVKLTVLLGLDTEQNCQVDVDKSRPVFIRRIMSFLFKPNKKTRKRVSSGDNTWKLLPPGSTCGCRSNCFKKVSKGQRQIILDYVKDLTEKRLLDSYLVNMIQLTKIVRKPGNYENLKRLRDVCYSYCVKYGTREVTVCKGAFTSIYNLTQSKMIQLQNKIKSGKNLPKKMDFNDFPPMPLFEQRKRSQIEEEDEDAVELETSAPKRNRSNKDKAYEPSEDSDESDNSDVDIETIDQGSLSDNNNQNASPSRSPKGVDKIKKENVQLKELSLVVKAIDNASKELLIDVHFLLYLNSADEDEAKAKILEFSGFPFDFDSEEYDERKEFLQRMSFKMVVDVARSFSLAIGNTKERTINNILSFLLKPDESLLRISAPMPVSLSDVELDDIDGMSDDSDISITCEVVEKKVECIDILSSDESDGESKKSGPPSSSVEAVKIKEEVQPTHNQTSEILRTVYQKPHNGARALKDYNTIKIFIDSYPHDYLNDIYTLLYMRPTPRSLIRHEILEFNGFSFDRTSVPFMKRRQLLDRMLYNSVRRIYNTLIYKPTDGRVLPKPQMVTEILEFLMELPDPDTRKRGSQEKSSSVSVSDSSPKPPLAIQPSPSTYSKKITKPIILAHVNPPTVPPAEVLGLKPGKLSDLKRVFQRVACFPCEYLTDVHKLLFMIDCDPSMIRQNIFGFRGFQFGPDSQEFKKRKNYLEYLTFHSLRKISSVLTTKSVDLRNSTKHELVTHLAEVLSEYCDKSTSASPAYPNRNYSKTTSTSPPKYREIQPKGSVPSNNIVTEKNPPLFFDNSVVENIVVTPLIDPSITGLPSSEMSTTFINAVQDIPKGITITESPLKIIEAHSVVPENSSKRSSTPPYPPSKKVALTKDSVAQKLEQCQQVYGTTVSLIPTGTGPAITGIVYSGGIVPQGVQYTAPSPSIVSTAVPPHIITTQATSLPIEEKLPLPTNVLQNEKTLKQNPSVTCLSDDEDCDKPLSSLVGYPIDSVLEKHVDDIVKNSDLQSITINGVIKKISDMYPKFDLSYRKEFLKSTVRSLLYRLGQEKSDTKRNTDSPDCSVTTTECIDSDSKSSECQVELDLLQ